jgi:integrase/recombinase XerD
MLKANLQDDILFAAVERIWRENRCLNDSSVGIYKYWVRRFKRYCQDKRLEEYSQLTLTGVIKFARWYASFHHIDSHPAICSARSALGTWAYALRILGKSLPPWSETTRPLRLRFPILKEFADYLQQYRGNPAGTIHTKVEHVNSFIMFLRQRGRRLEQIRLQDIDEYIGVCSKRYAHKTTASICSTLRSFTRFLLMGQRITVDFSRSIIAPKIVKEEHPRQVLPWNAVRSILQVIDRKSACGRRDYALLLLMSTYGLGAGEVISLTLDDIDWNAATLNVRRPKTGVEFQLPLLPAVAKALVSYLRHGRPAHTSTRHLFVTMKAPHKKLACSATIRHILHTHAHKAGINTDNLGTHLLRHAHACRQMELGATPKVIGDILGHRDPASTSAYIRVSVDRLRKIALAVPL